jgi:hypothetical protein
MSNLHEEPPEKSPIPSRRPYQAPTIESEPILEKQLLVICVSFELGCDQDPPQS